MIPEKQMNLCRDKIRKALHAADARVIFTSGGTEANNLALFGSIGAMRPPYRAAVSAVEHPSVLEASQRLEEMGCEVFRIPVNEAGELDYDALASFLQGGASLVSCMQVNNETGAKTDVARLSRLVRALRRRKAACGRRAGLPARGDRFPTDRHVHAVRPQDSRAQGRRRAGGSQESASQEHACGRRGRRKCTAAARKTRRASRGFPKRLTKCGSGRTGMKR